MSKLLKFASVGVLILLLGGVAFLYWDKEVVVELNTSSADLPGSSIIPAEQLINWSAGETVGVPDGIPDDRVQCVTAQCSAVVNASADYKNGTTNAVTLIQAAIDSAPAGTYVLVPAGTWRLNSALGIGFSKDEITLRGAGRLETIFDCRSNTCVLVGSGGGYLSTSTSTVTSGLSQGSTQINVADSTRFAVGQMALLQVENSTEPDSFVISVSGYPYRRSQMLEIVAKTGDTLTVSPPLYGVYDGLSAVLKDDLSSTTSLNQTNYSGVEDLTVDGQNGSLTFGLYLSGTYGSWLKNVRVINASNYNVNITDSLYCEVRDSHLDELNHSGSNGAGLLFQSGYGCLVENNIIEESFPNIEVNHGSAGNVFGYNFINNANALIGIGTNHGPHNTFNLYEGNIAHNLMSDGYFGGESDTTLFRNWFAGKTYVSVQTYCMSLKRFTRNFAIVGNLFGNSGQVADCRSYGQPNIGNGSWTGEAQLTQGDSWADWDMTNGTTNIVGTLSTRTSDTLGTVTLSSGVLTVGQTPTLWVNGAVVTSVMVEVVSGNSITINSSIFGTTLPAQGSALVIWPGAPGFQELDLDVEDSMFFAGNYLFYNNQIEMPLSGQTLPNSLYRNTKPEFFGSLAWPPFNPASPSESYEVIPAGYRFVNDDEVPPSPNPVPPPPPASSGGGGGSRPRPTPTTPMPRHQRGALVNYNGTVYFLGSEVRYPFPSAEVFLSWGANFSDVVPANSGDVAMPVGPVVEMKTATATRHPRGTLVNYNGTIYFLGTNVRYPFPSATIFLSWGSKFSDVVPANSGDVAMPVGAIVEMKK